MLVIRELNRALELINAELEEQEDADQREILLEALNGILEVKDYVATLAWIKRADAKLKFKRLLQSDFDYAKVAKEFNLKSTDSLYSSVSIASKNLEEKLGENLIELLLSNDQANIESALQRFRTGIGTLKLVQLFPRELIKHLPLAERSDSLTLSMCKTELDYLRDNTSASQKAKVASLDQTKLAHIRNILQTGEGPNSKDRDTLLSYINNEKVDLDVSRKKKVGIYAKDAKSETILFKQLDKALKSVYKNLALYGQIDEKRENLELKKLGAIKEIRDFVKEYNWLPADTRSASIKIIENVIQNDYNYHKIADKYGSQAGIIEDFISGVSEDVRSILGEGTIDLILDGDVEQGVEQFRVSVASYLE